MITSALLSPPTGDIDGVYPATEKAVIRNHVSYICRKRHCADTLVLYLNSPTCNDGTMLLWDANLNGIVRHTFIQQSYFCCLFSMVHSYISKYSNISIQN